MIHYYYSDGIAEFGPFTLNELKSKNLRPDYIIKTQATNFMETASKIPELESLFAKSPNKNPNYQQYNYSKPKTKSNSLSDKLLLISLALLILITIISTIINFAFRNSFSLDSNNQFVFLGLVQLFYIIPPFLVAFSIKNQTLKIIGIIMAVILCIRGLVGVFDMITMTF